MKNFAKNIPNILSITRFLFIPFIFTAIVNKQYLVAFILLTISGFTDVLDGFIARKYNFITNFGKLIDPLADKATQLFTLIALSFIDIIPTWFLVIIFIKEGVMVAGASFLYGRELVVSSRWFGKLATVLFYLAIVSSLAINFFNLSFHFDTYIYYLALATTLFSLVMYYREFMIKGYLNKEKLQTKTKSMTQKVTKADKDQNKERKIERKIEKLESKKDHIKEEK